MFDIPPSVAEIRGLDSAERRELNAKCFERLSDRAQVLVLELARLHFLALERGTCAEAPARGAARVLPFQPRRREE
jgi:hypothetical protein